ncbi:MAG: membrane protein of unknown function [Promethearchaeota archaeon]|nr:MAG: membrane protein of unknown function [Candidatus Lokiarchaeota archaeon]
MIKSVYILKRNGILLYSKNFMDQPYDDNILIGFFASVANFSREALESVVKFVDLGEDNKLILEPKPEEKIFGAAIVSSKDNNELVSNFLKDLLQDFIDEFSPDYELEVIDRSNIEEILQTNLKRYTTYSLPVRFALTWIILTPLSILFTLLNIFATEYLVLSPNPNFFTIEQILTRLIPQIVLFSFAELVIVFGIANFISGLLSLNLKVSFINALIYFIIIIITYFLSVQPVLIYIILAFLPFIIIASLGGAYIGHKIAIKRRIVK